jgi:hypothetical protein
MKKMMLLCTLFGLSACLSLGQNTKGAQTMVEFQSPKTGQPEKTAIATPTKPAQEILGRRVFYGGYLTEFWRAERKRSFFSLRTPVDSVKDAENLIYNQATNQIRGVALFSVKF